MSVTSIRIIPESAASSGENVLLRMEEVLAMAEAGKLSNVVVVAVLPNGDVMDCWANTSSPFTIVGGLESVKRSFMDACIA